MNACTPRPTRWGVEHGARRAYDAAGFQPLTPTRGLAGREVEPLAKRLRGEGRVLLDQGEQATVSFLDLRCLVKISVLHAQNSHPFADDSRKNAHNARRKGRNLTPEQAKRKFRRRPWDPSRMTPPRATITADNPAGTDGFEFVEFAHPDPQVLRDLFARMGLHPTPATHQDQGRRALAAG